MSCRYLQINILTPILRFCILQADFRRAGFSDPDFDLDAGGIMPAIKSPERCADAWKRRSAASTPDYEAGVRDPKTDWAQATKAAEGNYNKGVQAAMSRGAFGKGVSNAGTEKWQKNAIAKGTQRWAAGIALAEDAYIVGFTPYATTIANTKLPPRGPKGDPGNINRVAVMAKALHDKKLSLTSAK